MFPVPSEPTGNKGADGSGQRLLRDDGRLAHLVHGLIRRPGRALRSAARGLQQRLEIFTHDPGLKRHALVRAAAAEELIEMLHVPFQPFLGEAQPFAGQIL